jgi:hypothetical protein
MAKLVTIKLKVDSKEAVREIKKLIKLSKQLKRYKFLTLWVAIKLRIAGIYKWLNRTD